MKNPMVVRKLILSLFITGLLAYFMVKSPSPKIIFVPFLICGISMAGKCIALIGGQEKWAAVFHKAFILGFLLFWFGFLAVAAFICIRDQSYGMLLFTLPFWVVGFFIGKNKLLGKKSRKEASPFRFAFVVSTALVTITILAGIFLLILGVYRKELGLLFAGAFFALGAFTFVLGWLTVNGHFARYKIDVLGLYMGILVAGIGIGILLWKLEELRFWILVPVLMVIAGVLQIVKCLKNKR